MGKHRRPSQRVPWVRLRAAYAELAARYEALEADHVQLVGDVELCRTRHSTGWARREEELIRTQPVPVLRPAPDAPGLPPHKASELTHRAGLLHAPGGAWRGDAPGTTG